MSTNDADTLARDWPEPKNFRRSIRLEFSLYVSGIVLVLMLITGWVITDQYVKTVTTSVVEKLLVQARSYSGTAGKLIIAANGPDALLLNNSCKRLVADNPDAYWAGISGADSVFLAHTDLRQVISGTRLSVISMGSDDRDLRPDESFALNGDTIYIAVPIYENGIRIGTLAAASSAAPIYEARRLSITSVASITIIMILIGLPLTMVLLHQKLRPISIITDSLKGIDFSNLSLSVPVRGRNEFGYLAETLRVMGDKLNVAQRGLIEKERINRELEIAREIQNNILPRAYPEADRFEFCGTYESALEVGGDYYDFLEFDNGKLGFVVADVSGKSLPGMLVMLLTRDIVKRLSRTIEQPAEMLIEVNRELLPNIKKGMFVTMFYGVVDAESGRFTFASAGHNPLVHMHGDSGDIELIKTKGFPLGMMPEDQFKQRMEQRTIDLHSGDWLVQYTDGINEAHNDKQEEFGMQRLVSVLQKAGRENTDSFVSDVMASLRAFVGEAPQYDDITLLTMKWNGVHADEKDNQMEKAGRVS